MESKLKAECMDQCGELYENLLLREFGYPHLPNPVFVPEPKTKQAIVGLLENKSDAWNDAGTKPDHPCLCETRHNDDIGMGDDYRIYQYWNGRHFGLNSHIKKDAMESYFIEDDYQNVQWREVQP